MCYREINYEAMALVCVMTGRSSRVGVLVLSFSSQLFLKRWHLKGGGIISLAPD
jgi:hypothetical protein